MKKIIIFSAILILSLNFCNGQNQASKWSELIQNTGEKRPKVDELMQKMNIVVEIKSFVDNYIDKLSEKTTNISKSQWETIKTKIDYSAYLLTIKSILSRNYTDEEIGEILAINEMASPVNDTGLFIYEPKPIVQEQTYRVSRTFGKMLNTQLKTLIQKL